MNPQHLNVEHSDMAPDDRPELYNPRLCGGCQGFNSATRMISYASYTRNVLLADMVQQQNCLLCQLLSSLITKEICAIDVDFSGASAIEIIVGPLIRIDYKDPYHPWRPPNDVSGELIEDDTDSSPSVTCALCLAFTETGRWGRRSVNVRLFYEDEQQRNQLSRAEFFDTSHFDVELVKSWISKCEQVHGDTCWSQPVTVPKGFRLIDVEKLCVTLVTEPVRYVALSYVWGAAKGNDVQLTRGNVSKLSRLAALNHSALPDTIADALRLCADLGEGHLWVDRLCIVQDGVDKHDQIQAMDEIYGKAAFTIVASTEGADVLGLPGVRGRSRPLALNNKTRGFSVEGSSIETNFSSVIKKSPWSTRGWTFQEGILSPRILYVTDYQVYFSCSEHLVEEEAGTSRRYRDFRSSVWEHYDMLSHRVGVDTCGELHYSSYVKEYTSRNLSFETDVLNAFAGVSNMLASKLRTTFHFGIPEDNFLSALLWESGHHERRLGTPDIPSWSWAAWTGGITIGIQGLMSAYSIGTLVKLYVQDPEKGLRPVQQAGQDKWWFSSSVDFRMAQTAQTSYGYAAMPDVYKSTSAWKYCPHNPWSALNHEGLYWAAHREARKRPGCLVFNTTLAKLSMAEQYAGKYDLYTTGDNRIGQITLSGTLASRILRHSSKQCFIVICASLLEKRGRKASRQKQGRWYNSTIPTSVWKLCVMLVEVDDGITGMLKRVLARKSGGIHVVRRVGMGFVEMDSWHLANPFWTTIVLE